MTRRLMVIALFLIIATACGSAAEQLAENAIENELGENVDLDIDTDSGEIRIQSEDGSAVFGGGEIPAGLVVPVPDGGNVVTAFEGNDGDTVQYSVSVDFPGGSYEDIVAFYDERIGTGDGVTRVESTAGGRITSWTFQGHPDFGDGGVSVSDESEGPLLLITSTG